MSAAQNQQLYELWKKAGLIKGKKTPESSQALEARVVVLEATSENSSDESLFADTKLTTGKRNNPAFDRKGSSTRQSLKDALWLWPWRGDS